MVHEVSCVRNLNLSLGYHDLSRNQFLNPRDHEEYQQQLRKKSLIKLDQSLPSLTLGLGRDQDTINLIKQASSSFVSTVSSLSNLTSPKRERDFGDQELGKVFPMAINDNIDQDELEVGARKKLRLTKEQSFVMEENFKQHSTLSPKQKQTLAKSLHLQPRQVEVWFQNRRARTKLKQHEVDCALLKKCCEVLTSDNRRLKMEIQQLKTMKTTAIPQQFYMQFPAATQAMCPSCEKVVSGNGSGDTTKAFKTRTPNKSHSQLFSQLC